MANDYFDPTTVEIAAGTRALAAQVNAVSNAVSAGFDKLPTETELKLGLTRYAVDTGVADAYVLTLPYTPTLTDGFNLIFKAVNANTGASTINVNSTGVKAIVNPDGTQLVAGAFGNNAIIIIAYESVADRYILVSQNPAQAAQAAASAAAAATSEANAATSESNAATSESNAATSASNASTSESNAATSETNSGLNVTYAAEWANKAEDSLISVAAGGDNVDDYSALHHSAKADAQRKLFEQSYLGSKASDPSVDNEGNALIDGALYWNTTVNALRVYDLGGATWVAVTSGGDAATLDGLDSTQFLRSDVADTLTTTETTSSSLSITETTLTSGRALDINVNNATKTGQVVNIKQDHASSAANALQLESDGTGAALNIVTTNTGDSINIAPGFANTSINIASLAETDNVIDITANQLTSGYAIRATTNNGLKDTNALASFEIANAGADAAVLNLSTTGTGSVLTATGGEAVFAAATTNYASIELPHGVAPTAPVNGALWTTTAGLFVRVNGATVGPLLDSAGSGFAGISGTPANNQVAVWVDADNIEGATGFEWDGTNLTIPEAAHLILNGATGTSYWRDTGTQVQGWVDSTAFHGSSTLQTNHYLPTQVFGNEQGNILLTFDASTTGDIELRFNNNNVGQANFFWDQSAGELSLDVGGTDIITLSSSGQEVVGGILMTERADHAYTPAAGLGEIWLKNDAAQKLMFTDDAGADFEISPQYGTFAPTLTATTGTITVPTAGSDTWYYIKIGKLVVVTGEILINSVSSPTGTLGVSNPPFDLHNDTGIGENGLGLCNITNKTASDGLHEVLWSGTTAWIIRLPDGTNVASQIQANTLLRISFTYFTDD